MKVYIDSNILFEDYFFRGKFNSELLSIAEEYDLDIYISKIVVLELRNHYKEILEDRNASLKKLNKESHKFNFEKLTPNDLDIEDCLVKFDEFYSDLEDEEIINIIEPKDSDLSEVINRFTKKIKPFSKGKDEFKDTIIWLNYAEHANSLTDVQECLFLTNNTSDFCSKKDKSKVHEDLLSDCSKFKVYNSTYQFFNDRNEELDLIPIKFKLYIEELDLSDFNIRGELESKFFNEIHEYATQTINELTLYDVFDESYWEFVSTGYIETGGIDILECEDTDVTIIKDKAYINGSLIGMAEVDGYSYNSVRDKGDPQHSFAGSNEINFKIDFSYTLLVDEKVEDLELQNFEVL